MNQDIMQAFELMDAGYAQDALDVLDSLNGELTPDHPDYSFFQNTRGYCYCELKQFEKARQIYHDLVAVAQRMQDMDKLHVAYHQLGMTERLAGCYDKAIAAIKEEHSIIAQNFPEDALRLAVNLYEEGYLLYLMRNAEVAEKVMAQSLAYSLKTDDLVAQACAYRGMGEITGDRAYLDKAMKAFKEAGDNRGISEIEGMLAEREI
ncbi:tetratricopeptide repeat protein [Streptococcus merionis]|uniref:Tetratricopeptide repeat domain protein n=1 Tax=Streptococcus merionis TaxID=400065 RepID=A0A239SR80_9STRE|nr:tetratricopeptide repeat protein [Streptococcus merionis]SNU87749.1 tetratricopeptide repeat domain protein [Streptococcus merionis]